jgi:hypothetical protein
VYPSLKGLSVVGLGRAALLGTLQNTLRKAPDMGISQHKGTFTSTGNLESEEWLIYRGLEMMNGEGL